MGMVVRSNIMAVNSQRQLGMNSNQVGKALEKLSSGYRINRAGDDASGLAISEKMKAQIKGLDTASLNSQDGISLVQTAEGALTEVQNMMNRMTELATRAANGINSNENRQALQQEVTKLKEEIDRISESTSFNGINLLDGSMSDGNLITVTQPKNLNQKFTEADNGKGIKPSLVFDLKGMEVDGTGSVRFTIAGKEFNVAVEDGDTDEDIAKKLVTEFNDHQFSDNDGAGAEGAAGVFAMTAQGTRIVIEAKNAADLDDTKLKEALQSQVTIKGEVADPDLIKGDTVTFDFSNLKNPEEDITIKIAGKQFTFKDEPDVKKTEEVKIGKDLNETLKNLANAINSDAATKDKYIAHAKSGKIVLTMKDKVKAADIPEIDEAIKDTTWLGADRVNREVIGTKNGLNLQIGDTADSFNRLTVKIQDMSARGVGVHKVDISSREGAADAINVLRAGIDKVSSQRAVLGAAQNRLEYTINNLDTASENLQAANSRIRDTDMAKQMMEFTKLNVLTQSAQAMLAQANQQPQSILQLLQ